MRTRTKLLFAGLTAALLLTTAVSTASANRLSTNERRFRVQWASLEFTADGLAQTVRCPVTLEGSFHSATLTKEANVLIGHVSRASVRGALAVSSCTGGAATIFQESLPWHVRFDGFAGPLPRFERLFIKLVGARSRIQPLGFVACNVTTTAANPGEGWIEVEANGLVTGLTANQAASIPIEGGLCLGGGPGHFGGRGDVWRLGTTTNVRFTLI